mmetsp:Transcript_16036/g.20294  ORF Transcript_16036/g.20294 Transcript_16036/m.20294 type:complete len:125 (+) Transcript_16036:405-779(+)
MTSSIASIASVDPANAPDHFDESHWTDTNWVNLGAYEKSKTLAERAAWDFHKSLPEEERFGLSVVNPALVVGPTLIKTEFASGKIINLFMNNQLPGGIPRLSLDLVDVREVAQAHINCIEKDEA